MKAIKKLKTRKRKTKNKLNYQKAYGKIKENKIMKIFDGINVDENVKTELFNKLMLF